MKMLLVVPFDDKRGGVISVVDNLAKYLQARGHEVLFFLPGKTLLLKSRRTKLEHPGVELRLNMPFGPGFFGLLRTLVFPFLFLSSILQLLWLLRRRRIQIVNLHYPYDGYVYFAICRYLLPIRIVTSVHGRDAFYRERPKARYSRAFKFLIESSDLIVLPSNTYRKKFLEAFPGVQDKTIFIHNGINPEQFRPSEVQPERIENKRYILCVAELQEYKGIDVLLHAARQLFTEDPSLTLVLAGDGPMRAELVSLASTLGISNQTRFLGTQGVIEITRLMHGCETLVLPSRMEPFGIVLIEAMACKKPVVASAVGGIPEIVDHEISGILVEPENPQALADGLRRVLSSGEFRSTLGENGYATVMERFCSMHNGAAYQKAFESVLGLEQPPPLAPSETSAMGF
jgi:glycosyltransferase involved in cell wall biosynthesis